MDTKLIIVFVVILFILNFFYEYSKKRKTDTKSSRKIASNSEYRIAQYLDRLNVKYKSQYTFNGCRDRNKLPFDFAIINDKGVVLLLIEYDGEQHFHPVQFSNEGNKKATENFKLCQRHDNIKNSFCKRRKIPLLRISYLDNKNIEKILKKNLIEYKII